MSWILARVEGEQKVAIKWYKYMQERQIGGAQLHGR